MSSSHFRRQVFIAVALFAGGSVLVSCGSSSPSDDTALASTADSSVDGASSTTEPAKTEEPKATLPKVAPTKLVITDITEGTGVGAAVGDLIAVHYVGVLSSDGTRFDGNFGSSPFSLTLGKGQVIKGWDEGLLGMKTGGMRQLDIPADLAYGDSGSGDVIKPGAALSFVVEMVGIIPATDPADEPKLTIAGAAASSTLQSKDLIEGKGEAIAAGDTVAVHIVAYRGDTGEKITSTWPDGAPVSLTLEASGSLPGIIKGVPGMKVGGRRQLTVPFADAFGPEGNTEMKLPAKTDLVLVVDLIAAL
ncbi:MAG: FKBP-type peptidyl-prolyl cis-trans isomerase [Ilumatobacteraceae bacterium]|nr:FKBP-type peptidyl-prolyl cis-trans isomerase [Ilumatobacteraceae bacterium]